MKKSVFECEMCAYVSGHRGDFNKHLASKKHKKRVESGQNSKKTRTCDWCNKEFADRHSLYRHQKNKVCQKNRQDNTDNKNDDKSIMEESIKEEMVISNELMKDLIKEFAEMTKVLKAQRYTKSVNQYTNLYNFQFIEKNYKNAPALQSMTEDEISKIKHKPDEDIINCLIYHQRYKSLPRYIADIITEYYKKDDPSQQSMWNSDSSRLHYIIMLKLKNESNNWFRDKDGKHVVEAVIRPILQFIKKEIEQHFASQAEQFENDFDYDSDIDSDSDYENENNTDFDKLVKNNKLLGSIVTDINTRHLEQKILKKMSPNFNLCLIES